MAEYYSNEKQKIKQMRLARQKKKQRRQKRIRIVTFVVLLCVLFACIFMVGRIILKGNSSSKTQQNVTADAGEIQDTQQGMTDVEGGSEETTGDTVETTEPSTESREQLVAQAGVQAATYDYDGAIATLQTISGWETDTEITTQINQYTTTKSSCVPVDVDRVPHIFYHSLVNNTAKVFDGDSDSTGYNSVMTTIDEFNKITQQMYDNGYVLVRLRDLVNETTDADGTVHFTKNTSLLLPAGKKAFVLSVDDLSYYHYMADDGFPDRLVVDDDGSIKCKVIKDDGSDDIGNYDVVPLMNQFLTEHPDGCYKGARGMIALTGYNGVLGYRTDTDYRDKLKLQQLQQEWLDAHPGFNYDQECADAKKVAEAVKATGWEFASHSWGHKSYETLDLEQLKTDNQKWQDTVVPIVGKTDLLIYPFGADIGTWEGYTADNAKYEYLSGQGFHFFCNVDSSPYWVQITDGYVRQGRRNLDGYQMWKSMNVDNNLEDLFHVADVFDSSRPTPVEQA